MKSEFAFLFPPKAKAPSKPRAKAAKIGAEVKVMMPGNPTGTLVSRHENKGWWNVEIDGNMFGMNRDQFKVV